MKTRSLCLLLPLALLLSLSGCKNYGQYIDTTTRATGPQMLNGAVRLPPGVALPADASLTVRLIDLSRDGLSIAEQTIEHPGQSPIAFSLSYRAEDIQLPHRARIEARVSYGGKLRLISNRTSAEGLVTPENASQPFDLQLNAFTSTQP